MILHWLLNPRGVVDVLQAGNEALAAQREVIRSQTALIQQLRNELLRSELEHTRISRDLIDQFVITLDTPEVQESARIGLFIARVEFMDQVARLEEQLT